MYNIVKQTDSYAGKKERMEVRGGAPGDGETDR